MGKGADRGSGAGLLSGTGQPPGNLSFLTFSEASVSSYGTAIDASASRVSEGPWVSWDPAATPALAGNLSLPGGASRPTGAGRTGDILPLFSLLRASLLPK